MSTVGYPLILAMQSRRPDPASPGNFLHEIKGYPDLVGILFTEGSTRFRCRRGTGHFLVIFQSATEREDLRIEVTSPTFANKPYNVAEARKVTWNQIISIPVTQSGSRGQVMTLGTPEQMARELVCNSHLSLEFGVELAFNEDCIISVTGDPDRSWDLVVIRMLPEGINIPFVEHPNLIWANQPAFSGTGWTRTELNPATNVRTGLLFRFYRIVNNSAATFSVLWMNWSVNETDYAHDTIVRIRKSATHPGGGSIRVRLQNSAGTVTYVTQTVTIPTDATEIDVVYNGLAGGPFAARVLLDEFAIGDQVEIAVACLVVS